LISALAGLTLALPSTEPTPHCLLQNVWRNPSLRGEWAQGGGGVLAAEERALLDAYGSRK
jgi:hypothetical protein